MPKRRPPKPPSIEAKYKKALEVMYDLASAAQHCDTMHGHFDNGMPVDRNEWNCLRRDIGKANEILAVDHREGAVKTT